MAFSNKIGDLLKKAVSSSPSIFQSIRCMSSSKVFVGGLSYGTNDHSLKEAFNNYGEVIEARVIIDRESGRSRGFGFVTFASTEEASAAVSAMDGKDLEGRTVRVNYATDRPRNNFGGGGFGGGGYGGGSGGYGGGSGGYGGGGYGGRGGGGYDGSGGYGGGSGGYGGGEMGGYGGRGGGGYGGRGGGGNFGESGGYGGKNAEFGGGSVGNFGASGGYGGKSVPASGGFGGFGNLGESGGYAGKSAGGGIDAESFFPEGEKELGGEFGGKDEDLLDDLMEDGIKENNHNDDEPNDFADKRG